MKRSATAVWNGSGKDGKGYLTSQSEVLNKTSYSWNSRFTEGKGTNPEELIAAAHAGCFTMKLSFELGEAGYTAEKVETNSTITIEDGTITDSYLTVKAKVPDISQEAFDKCVESAAENCPVSKLLNVDISVESSLV